MWVWEFRPKGLGLGLDVKGMRPLSRPCVSRCLYVFVGCEVWKSGDSRVFPRIIFIHAIIFTISTRITCFLLELSIGKHVNLLSEL